MLIAIQPDDYTAYGKVPESDASSPRWARLLQAAGHEVRWVDVYRPDILEQLQGCHGFMWRWGHFGGMGAIARRLLPVIERELGLIVYPNQNTCWHYDDKVAQSYLLKAKGIPIPKTWTWYRSSDAQVWFEQEVCFPVVLKLSGGAGSENVILIRSLQEAKWWIGRMFSVGVFNLKDSVNNEKRWGLRKRVKGAGKALLLGRPLWAPRPTAGLEFHKGYMLVQEFLPNNQYDTRVTVVGNRAFAFHRKNRPNDFRASGSGALDYNTDSIDIEFVRLAFRTSLALGTQSIAIDGLYNCIQQPVVAEVSYTYVSSAIRDCSGHWVQDGCVDDGHLAWVGGSMWPEEAQIADYIEYLSIAGRSY